MPHDIAPFPPLPCTSLPCTALAGHLRSQPFLAPACLVRPWPLRRCAQPSHGEAFLSLSEPRPGSSTPRACPPCPSAALRTVSPATSRYARTCRISALPQPGSAQQCPRIPPHSPASPCRHVAVPTIATTARRTAHPCRRVAFSRTSNAQLCSAAAARRSALPLRVGASPFGTLPQLGPAHLCRRSTVLSRRACLHIRATPLHHLPLPPPRAWLPRGTHPWLSYGMPQPIRSLPC